MNLSLWGQRLGLHVGFAPFLGNNYGKGTKNLLLHVFFVQEDIGPAQRKQDG